MFTYQFMVNYGLRRKLHWGLALALSLTAISANARERVQDNIRLEEVLKKIVPRFKTNGADVSQKYALLVNGDLKNCYESNISHAYESLRKSGFPDENIFVLSSNNAKGRTNIDETVNAFPTKENFDSVIKGMTNFVTPRDTVIVYTTGHGLNDFAGNPRVILQEGSADLFADEFVQDMRRLKSKNMVYIGDQCFSGAFLDEFKKSGMNFIGISASDAYKVVKGASFNRDFWNSFEGMSPYGMTNEVDFFRAVFYEARGQNRIRGLENYKNWRFDSTQK